MISLRLTCYAGVNDTIHMAAVTKEISYGNMHRSIVASNIPKDGRLRKLLTHKENKARSNQTALACSY